MAERQDVSMASMDTAAPLGPYLAQSDTTLAVAYPAETTMDVCDADEMDDDELVTEACFARKHLGEFPQAIMSHEFLHFLDISHNNLREIPEAIGQLQHLVQLTFSHNSLVTLPKNLAGLTKLVHLDVSNNNLTDLPSTFADLQSLQMLYAGGNHFETVPVDLYQMPAMRRLYLGGNRISHIVEGIDSMIDLEILYLGGNQLGELPESIGLLPNLAVLYLGDNQLHTLPASLAQLQQLRVLNLHNNNLTTLPQGVVALTELQQLSLRGNPLVTDFVSELPKEPLSLLEICARTIKVHQVQYERSWLPTELNKYLDSSLCCSNPSCSGVYFTKGVKQINFVDFCGRYRVPLMNYLCAPPCHQAPRHPRDSLETQAKMQRVLLSGYVEPDMVEEDD